MAGTVVIMPGVDLTAASDEVWNAEKDRPRTIDRVSEA
jgi:hypothetical protein